MRLRRCRAIARQRGDNLRLLRASVEASTVQLAAIGQRAQRSIRLEKLVLRTLHVSLASKAP